MKTMIFVLIVIFIDDAQCEESKLTGGLHTISGFVWERGFAVPDVAVCLCEGTSGMPVAKETYQSIDWLASPPDETAKKIAIAVTDDQGHYQFTKLPPGKYRLIAQKWIGPYKGLLNEHSSVIQLMGFANDVAVPRPADADLDGVILSPPGDGIIKFDQDIDNNDCFVFLSTTPPEYDPILGLRSMGPSFHRQLIGMNRMPNGKTIVIGVPNDTVYAFFFASDSAPGFATLAVRANPSGFIQVPPEPYVAGWSDARKTPPPKLAELIAFMNSKSLTPREILGIPRLSFATSKEYDARMVQLNLELDRVVQLPEGRSSRVGDLLAAEAYLNLNARVSK